MSYQTFPDSAGASDSPAKLKALQLPDLTGKTVLDIGCNTGFFCMYAKEQGASEVTGIDISAAFISQATERATEKHLFIEYYLDHWNRIPDKKYDVILFLSSLHYEKNPVAFFDNIYSHLSDDGILVLECGISPTYLHKNSITKQTRHDGVRFYPDIDTLLKVWLKKFSCRLFGLSVKQDGDNVNRFVIHCSKKVSTVIFISGNPSDGKSNLAKRLNPDICINTDVLFGEEFKDTDVMAKWESRNGTEYYTDIILQAIELNCGAELIVVEGYILKDLYEDLKKALRKSFRIWHLQR